MIRTSELKLLVIAAHYWGSRGPGPPPPITIGDRVTAPLPIPITHTYFDNDRVTDNRHFTHTMTVKVT